MGAAPLLMGIRRGFYSFSESCQGMCQLGGAKNELTSLIVKKYFAVTFDSFKR
jgi:hypothetical protein